MVHVWRELDGDAATLRLQRQLAKVAGCRRRRYMAGIQAVVRLLSLGTMVASGWAEVHDCYRALRSRSGWV